MRASSFVSAGLGGCEGDCYYPDVDVDLWRMEGIPGGSSRETRILAQNAYVVHNKGRVFTTAIAI